MQIHEFTFMIRVTFPWRTISKWPFQTVRMPEKCNRTMLKNCPVIRNKGRDSKPRVLLLQSSNWEAGSETRGILLTLAHLVFSNLLFYRISCREDFSNFALKIPRLGQNIIVYHTSKWAEIFGRAWQGEATQWYSPGWYISGCYVWIVHSPLIWTT